MTPVGTPDPNAGWQSADDLDFVRSRVPVLYVEALPVRLDGAGTVTEVGLLLRANSSGTMTRSLVAGRVMHGESVREALLRHIEKDLGPMAFPQLPPAIAPVTVAEYHPLPGVTKFYDARQHAVSLCYVVPVTGTCDPRQDALELTWLSPAEANTRALRDELEGGRGALLATLLSALGALD